MPLPRLTFDELPTAAREAVRPRFERLGYLGEVFSLVGHNETSLLALLAFADNVGASASPEQKEIVALTVSTLNGARAELNQHEQRSLRIGMSSARVAAVETLELQHPELDDGDAAIMRLAIATTRSDWSDARAALYAVVESFGAEVAVALLMQTGYYLMANAVGHVLDVQPQVPSIFEE